VTDQDANEDIKIRADAHAVRTILDNIVDNAVKYCPPGLVLKVRVFTEGRKAVVEISDNGPGFASDMAEKIFEAYKYRADQLPGTNHGTGMGLCISRKLARRMGGELKASGKKGDTGARFLLFLNRIQSK
jgi:two-component system OmpR family sensor kinase